MDDLISRQAAIDTLKDLTANGTNRGMISGEDAVHRIEMLPPAQPEPCEDAVSRKAVIDTIDEWNEACADSGHKETVSDIMLIRKDFIDLPPVTPKQFERIRGRWVKGYDGRHAVCSNCEAWWIPFGEGYKADYHFCPNCGAKMEGDAE